MVSPSNHEGGATAQARTDRSTVRVTPGRRRPMIRPEELFVRSLLAAIAVVAGLGPTTAASVPMGAGHGAIDARRNIDAVGLGEEFCAARLVGDMSRIDAHVAPLLAEVLARARGDVPWQTYSETPTWCEVEPMGATDTAGVLLRVNYTADGHRWSDTLSLQRTPTTWLINNVFYEGGGNLRFRLVEAACTT